ncbi:hypothetical protein B0H14DRAFT_2622831 [Mycena olivaceomarginata]|nr:hypothetical protein B0H14DRAFT_2622831 [Mycena olivaceomarginata]
MKFFSLLLLVPSSLFTAVNAWHDIRDAPSNPIDIQDGQTGVLMVLPPAQTDTSIKRVPEFTICALDADHPFIAPGPNDMRGPLEMLRLVSDTYAAGMNTLANHGYISRKNQGAGMAAMNILTRGNPFVNKISIGGVLSFRTSPAGSNRWTSDTGNSKTRTGRSRNAQLSKGDASITRADVHIGDNRNFNKTLWDTVGAVLVQDLEILANFGDDGPDGPATVFNLQTLIEMKRQKLESDQLLDADAHSHGIDTHSIVSTFANGTTGLATKHIMTSFLMDQKFPDNWFRNGFPMQGSFIPAQIAAALPQWVPGRNDENGVFVADPPAPAPFNISGGCANYWDGPHKCRSGASSERNRHIQAKCGFAYRYTLQRIRCTEPLAPAGPTNT